MKKLLITTLLLTALIFTGCNKKEKIEDFQQEKIKVNTNEQVVQEQEINGLKISDISVVYKNNESILTTSITNISDVVVLVDSVIAKYTYSDGTTTSISILVNSSLVSNQTVYADSKTSADLTKAVKVEYEIIYIK